MSQTNTYSQTGQTVVGVFDDVAVAERAINDLKAAGFTPDAISVVTKDRQEQKDLTEASGNKAGEGALAGALAGGTLGAVVGWLLAGGTALIPGIGPVVAAGIFGATVTGALVGGTVGSVATALIGEGVPEEEAAEYEHHVKGGRTLLSVKTANEQRLENAIDVFDRNNATEVRYYNEGETGSGRIYSRGNQAADTATSYDPSSTASSHSGYDPSNTATASGHSGYDPSNTSRDIQYTNEPMDTNTLPRDSRGTSTRGGIYNEPDYGKGNDPIDTASPLHNPQANPPRTATNNI
jgi:hypothetical protein